MLDLPSRLLGRQRALGTILAVRAVTPRMRRITLGGEEIAAFVQGEGVAAPAAWVKLFVPSGEGRAYTLSSVNRHVGTADIDLMLHGSQAGGGDGPASRWAAQARVGERVHIAGPRNGGFMPPADTEWLMLAGDATALPAIQAIAASVPSSMRVEACIEIHDDAEQQPIETVAHWHTQWVRTAGGEPGIELCQQMLHRPLPGGPGYLWLAGESAAVRELKRHFQERGVESQRLSAKGYWKRGAADHRD